MPQSSAQPHSGLGGEGRSTEATEAFAPRLRRKMWMTLKHAVSLVSARIRFRGGHVGAADSAEPVLKGGESLYLEDGKIWRKKTHKEVPSMNHSVSEIQDYVSTLPQKHVVEYTEAKDFPQYRGMIDFVTTSPRAQPSRGRRKFGHW